MREWPQAASSNRTGGEGLNRFRIEAAVPGFRYGRAL
jgi:hypothetical protein